MKPQRDLLPIWCPHCQRTTYQPIAKLQANVCICTLCGKAITMSAAFVAVVKTMKDATK